MSNLFYPKAANELSLKLPLCNIALFPSWYLGYRSRILKLY